MELDRSMAGRVCLVTGATAGIGLVTARELAGRGASVTIVGRSRDRCEATVRRIRSETNNARVEYLVADLSSMAAVRGVAREFCERHDRLHVLINNAGAIFALREESVEGIEKTLALNHLAYFLLTSLLLDVMKASGNARIVNISSDAHQMARTGFDFDDPQALRRRVHYGQSKFKSLLFTLLLPPAHPGLKQYAQTKLANLLFTYELARRLEETNVTVNAVHPGFVATNFTAGNGVLGWFMRLWARVLAISVEEGARTPIYLATSPEVEGVNGRYFVKQQAVRSSAASLDEAAAARLWQLSEEMIQAAIGAGV